MTDWYNQYVWSLTEGKFNKNARANQSKKIQPAFRKFLREHGSIFNNEDILKPLSKAWNPVTKRIVNRSTMYTKAGHPRSKYRDIVRRQYQPDIVFELSEIQPQFGVIKKFNTVDYDCKLVQTYESASTIDILEALMNACVPKMHGSLSNRILIETMKMIDGVSQKVSWSHAFVTNEVVQSKYPNDSLEQAWVKFMLAQLQEVYAMEEWDFTNATITLQTNFVPQGGGCTKLPAFLQAKRGIFHIINDDDLCGQRCLAAYVHGGYKDLNRKGRGEKQLDKLTKNMCERLNMHGKMSYIDFDKFAKEYKKMVVILHDVSGEAIHTSEDEREDTTSTEHIVYIFHDVTIEHYHLVTKMDAFLSTPNRRRKWCPACVKSYEASAFQTHDCKAKKCKCCQSSTDHSTNKKWIRCGVCNKFCFNNECLQAHMVSHQYKCSNKSLGFKKGDIKDTKKWMCGKCNKWVDMERHLAEEHVCGEIKCDNCHEFHTDADHRCNIMKPLSPKHSSEEFIAFDFESKFVDGIHTVNFAHLKYLYPEARKERYAQGVGIAMANGAELEDIPPLVLKKSFNNINDFVEFARSCHKTTFIAHNMKGYDGWLIHHHLRKNFGRKPDKIILAGDKIMYMQFEGGVRFIDSLNFIQSTLSDMPSMFGLDESQFKKGYFPYIMNTNEYENYKGPMPPVEMFEPEKMKPTSRNLKKCKGCMHKATLATQKDFYDWHAAEVASGKVYDFQKELVEYCVSDVDILRKSLEVFRDDMMEQNYGADPLQYITIAGYCQHVYLMFHAPTEKELEEGLEIGSHEYPQTALAVLKKDEYDAMKKGFKGGRTEVFRQHREWSDDEIKKGIFGRYIDIASLYPSVQFFDELPYGIPTVHDFGEDGRDDVDVRQYFGYVVCDVQPPSDLKIPLLGGTSESGKFCFGLDRMCKATIPTPELHKSLELGYKIERVYKVFHFKKSRDLFKSYIRTFSRAKIESGFKGSDSERDELIQTYKEKFGIELRAEHMKPNPGRKLNSKLMLNSLWGKFGQRQMKTSKYLLEPTHWYKLLGRSLKGEVAIHSRVHMGDCLYVEYMELEESNTNLKATNVALCGMVTSNARLRLYEVIGDKRLQDRVLYCDTDSAIYEYRKDEYNPKEGELLGEWEPEFDEPMKKFVAVGPKTYAYQKKSGHFEVKSKGVQLTHENLKCVNFDTYKKLVDDGTNIQSSAMLFKKTKEGLSTVHTPKILQLEKSSFKRQLVEGSYDTLPFGYKKQKTH